MIYYIVGTPIKLQNPSGSDVTDEAIREYLPFNPETVTSGQTYRVYLNYEDALKAAKRNKEDRPIFRALYEGDSEALVSDKKQTVEVLCSDLRFIFADIDHTQLFATNPHLPQHISLPPTGPGWIVTRTPNGWSAHKHVSDRLVDSAAGSEHEAAGSEHEAAGSEHEAAGSEHEAAGSEHEVEDSEHEVEDSEEDAPQPIVKPSTFNPINGLKWAIRLLNPTLVGGTALAAWAFIPTPAGAPTLAIPAIAALGTYLTLQIPSVRELEKALINKGLAKILSASANRNSPANVAELSPEQIQIMHKFKEFLIAMSVRSIVDDAFGDTPSASLFDDMQLHFQTPQFDLQSQSANEATSQSEKAHRYELRVRNPHKKRGY
jgi:hypothetical protein